MSISLKTWVSFFKSHERPPLSCWPIYHGIMFKLHKINFDIQVWYDGPGSWTETRCRPFCWDIYRASWGCLLCPTHCWEHDHSPLKNITMLHVREKQWKTHHWGITTFPQHKCPLGYFPGIHQTWRETKAKLNLCTLKHTGDFPYLNNFNWDKETISGCKHFLHTRALSPLAFPSLKWSTQQDSRTLKSK